MPDPYNTPNEIIIREKIPVFAPKKIVEVAAYTEWEPSVGDVAFFSSADTTFTLGAGDSEDVYVNLMQGQVMGIRAGQTFTFPEAVVLAVM